MKIKKITGFMALITMIHMTTLTGLTEEIPEISTKETTVRENIKQKTEMDGIDISSWQKNIDMGNVEADFVIIKASEGTYYKNPYFEKHCRQAEEKGIYTGYYHYFGNGEPVKEAEYFLDMIGDKLGQGLLILDWESINNTAAFEQGPERAKVWLDYVYRKTHIKPIIYTGYNEVNFHDYKAIHDAGYELWGARYPHTKPQNGYDDEPWTPGNTQWGPWGKEENLVIRQYSSTGKLDGYDGSLDFNKAYMNAETWEKLSHIDENYTCNEGIWLMDNTGWWYEDEQGNALRNEWKKLDNNWYYFGNDNYSLRKWQKIDPYWFYMNNSGEMQRFWQKIDGYWYFFRNGGQMKTGWIYDNGHWYFMRKGGQMKTGWIKVRDKWYFARKGGQIVTNQWRWINKKCYYFYKDGHIAQDTIIQGSRVDESGAWIKE